MNKMEQMNLIIGTLQRDIDSLVLERDMWLSDVMDIAFRAKGLVESHNFTWQQANILAEYEMSDEEVAFFTPRYYGNADLSQQLIDRLREKVG